MRSLEEIKHSIIARRRTAVGLRRALKARRAVLASYRLKLKELSSRSTTPMKDYSEALGAEQSARVNLMKAIAETRMLLDEIEDLKDEYVQRASWACIEALRAN